MKKLLNIFVLVCLCVTAGAQELNCKVTVLHDKLNGVVDAQVFTAMERALNDFMNTKKWTTDEFAPVEKIDCNFLINLVGNKVGGDPNVFSATFSIQATRPVYNTSYTSTIVNYVDKELVFRYTQNNSIRFNDNQVSGTDPLASNITAVMAFYTYIVLALDYDSFAPSGGTNFLKKAQNVVNNAPEGKGISGWKSVESTRNRYWIVEQLLNTRFQDVRNFWYMMHREGLDSMYVKPVVSRNRILTNIRKLYQVSRENPNSIVLQFFFNAKSNELISLLTQAPKQERAQYITMLAATDVANAGKYNALR